MACTFGSWLDELQSHLVVVKRLLYPSSPPVDHPYVFYVCLFLTLLLHSASLVQKINRCFSTQEFRYFDFSPCLAPPPPSAAATQRLGLQRRRFVKPSLLKANITIVNWAASATGYRASFLIKCFSTSSPRRLPPPVHPNPMNCAAPPIVICLGFVHRFLSSQNFRFVLYNAQKEGGMSELEKGAVKAVQDLYDVVHHDILSMDLRKNYETWELLSNARTEGCVFAKLKWPNDRVVIEDMQAAQVKNCIHCVDALLNERLEMKDRFNLKCFVLPSGCKLVFTLQDVLYITGLPIDGRAVSRVDNRGEYLTRTYLEKDFVVKERALKFTWLRDKFQVVPPEIGIDGPELLP
ncbi:hypothetical protein C1H46_038364 [Malus baccata]|uniref:Uncharacterized protein n=1 Tax=Malus baccata TaxID=106549 RepID=A0A540KPF4_MALBA|nr:hypothetical protein C1H46_038364 [Malus baccata]